MQRIANEYSNDLSPEYPFPYIKYPIFTVNVYVRRTIGKLPTAFTGPRKAFSGQAVPLLQRGFVV